MADEALRFIQVGELVKDISEGTLPADDALAGRSLSLHAEDATVTALSFAQGGRLSWEVTAGPGAGETGEETCHITRPREEVAVVDYVASTRRATAVTIVLDLARSAATTVVGTLPTADQAARGAFALATGGAELTLVAAGIVPAVIDGPFVPGAHPHVPTDDLVGKRVQYVYSQTEAYEHIYLSRDLYTWQCLRGSGAGTRRHRPLSLPQGRRGTLPLRVAREGHPDARRGPGGLESQAVQRQAVRVRGQRLRSPVHDADLCAGDPAQRDDPRVVRFASWHLQRVAACGTLHPYPLHYGDAENWPFWTMGLQGRLVPQRRGPTKGAGTRSTSASRTAAGSPSPVAADGRSRRRDPRSAGASHPFRQRSTPTTFRSSSQGD